ncbi:hypothetical protein ABIB94_008186 [Bradyrhizobium sp. JR7.2]|uniref:hypothetical protein n=1 Tax=unclassified Bradyrhizobium TaxID=2631580 RepID=UPI00339B021E
MNVLKGKAAKFLLGKARPPWGGLRFEAHRCKIVLKLPVAAQEAAPAPDENKYAMNQLRCEKHARMIVRCQEKFREKLAIALSQFSVLSKRDRGLHRPNK